jgi:hypothetical protein
MNSFTEFNTLDSVIATLVASYQTTNTPAPRMVQVKRTRTDCPAAKKALVSKQNSPTVREMSALSAVASTPAPVVNPLPIKGSIDAAEYFKQMRHAKTCNERISAIAAFIGYDPSLSYSSQEVAANIKARQAAKPVVALPAPVHSVQATVKGFVAGANDAAAKHKANLLAREFLAGNVKADHIKSYNAAFNRGDYSSAATFLALIKVEEERMTEIAADLAAL